jgi:DUF1680 family protein
LKVSRHLFTWSAEAAQADFYERALLNGILGNMNIVNGAKAASRSSGLSFALLF